MDSVVRCLKVLQMIFELAQATKCGFLAFSNMDADECDCGRIVYDDSKGVLVRDDDIFEYPVAMDKIVTQERHEIVSTYDDCCDDVEVRAVIVPVKDSDAYCQVVLRFYGRWEQVNITDGRWEIIDVLNRKNNEKGKSDERGEKL